MFNDDNDFQSRKSARRKYYELFVKGWKQRICTACAGSGKYDAYRNPLCGACNGTGKERYKDA